MCVDVDVVGPISFVRALSWEEEFVGGRTGPLYSIHEEQNKLCIAAEAIV